MDTLKDTSYQLSAEVCFRSLLAVFVRLMHTLFMGMNALSTHDKALGINIDAARYGTFAEIGAGQEVARWFFHVGGAAATIAKTMSAYDMAVSDAVYGPGKRYVSRQRLQSMLDHEWSLLLERLEGTRGPTTKFFVFADTVTARSFSRREEGQGWLGIRFQAEPRAQPSEIIIHSRMWDQENARQQEALGVLGVNLIYGAFNDYARPEILIASLMDSLTRDRMEVDMIRFSGPAFDGVDNRLMSLQLVQQRLTNAALFAPYESAVPSTFSFGLSALCLFLSESLCVPQLSVSLPLSSSLTRLLVGCASVQIRVFN